MSFKQKLAAVFIVFAVYKLNPLYIRSSILDVAGSFTTNLAPTQDPRSLKAAFANVTADYDQLTSLLEDFFERMADNTTEMLLRDYLLVRSSRKHKFLERFFDFLLSVYWFILPFLLVYVGAMVLGSGDSGGSGERRLASPEGGGRRSKDRCSEGSKQRPYLSRRSLGFFMHFHVVSKIPNTGISQVRTSKLKRWDLEEVAPSPPNPWDEPPMEMWAFQTNNALATGASLFGCTTWEESEESQVSIIWAKSQQNPMGKFAFCMAVGHQDWHQYVQSVSEWLVEIGW